MKHFLASIIMTLVLFSSSFADINAKIEVGPIQKAIGILMAFIVIAVLLVIVIGSYIVKKKDGKVE